MQHTNFFFERMGTTMNRNIWKWAFWIAIGISFGALIAAPQAATLLVNPNGGQYTTIQAALDAANPGDTVVVSGGTYTEDLSIGHFNYPSKNKSNIVLKSAEGEVVEVIAANQSNRFAGLAAAGYSLGDQDRAGLVINGDGARIEGIRFIQPSAEMNALRYTFCVLIGSSNVTLRNCEVIGPHPEDTPTPPNDAGDMVGITIASVDVYGLMEGGAAPPSNLTVENCSIHHCEFGFGSSDLLQTGVPPSAIISNSEFYYNYRGAESNDGMITFNECHFFNNNVACNVVDDEVSFRRCQIERSTSRGVLVDDYECEDDESAEFPAANFFQCTFNNNAGDGLQINTGTVSISDTLFHQNSGLNLYLGCSGSRESKVTINQCDFYQAGKGVAIQCNANPTQLLTMSLENSIISDGTGLDLETAVGDIRVSYCNFFVTGEAVIGDFLTLENLLYQNPVYMDPAQGDFRLNPSSPLIQAGNKGQTLGSQGVGETSIDPWIHYGNS
jgi:hypothetical protein